MKKYRLYIDESGTHHYGTQDCLSKRYLGLTGIIISSDNVENILQPKIIELKKMFTDDPDDLPILHREDIVDKRGVYAKLNDTDFERMFNDAYLCLLSELDFNICSVVVDKKNHLERYQDSANHPYHYCLDVLLERYTNFLEKRGVGDVWAESRGKKEDDALRSSYERFYTCGTNFRSVQYIQQTLTSKKIKLKPKIKAVAGIELADLLSLPTRIDILHAFGKIQDLDDNFNKKVIDKIQGKYFKGDFNSKTKGYGKKYIG